MAGVGEDRDASWRPVVLVGKLLYLGLAFVVALRLLGAFKG